MKLKQLKSTEIKSLRERLLKKQKGVCPICGKKIVKPVLDHHHKKKVGGTGRIRKVLCSACNIFLGKIENNSKRYLISNEELPHVLRRTSEYLLSPQLPIIHPSEAPKKKILTKSSYNKIAKLHEKALSRNEKVPKLPVYRVNSKKKPVQGLTKPLEALFTYFKVKPEFYGDKK